MTPTNRAPKILALTLLALALLGLFWVAQDHLAPHVSAQAESGEPTPTPDRLLLLAEPTLPANPGQADLGAQSYWLNCMPCHGQRGQGLTGDFRNLYPPEDQNCWNSGCHGSRPYEDGFTLPTVVPPVIGPGALDNFQTAGNVFGFIAAAMPFQAPGSLDSESYWQITAFLLRENGVALEPEPLNPENAMQVRLRPEATPAPPLTVTPVDESGPASATPSAGEGRLSSTLIWGLAVLLLGGGVAVWLVRRGRL